MFPCSPLYPSPAPLVLVYFMCMLQTGEDCTFCALTDNPRKRRAPLFRSRWTRFHYKCARTKPKDFLRLVYASHDERHDKKVAKSAKTAADRARQEDQDRIEDHLRRACHRLGRRPVKCFSTLYFRDTLAVLLFP